MTDRSYAIEHTNHALLHLLGRPRRVLDVGCGGGINGQRARARGVTVTGLEGNAAARTLAAERLNETLDVDLEDAAGTSRKLGDRHFDLLLFADVLEHVRRPEELLRALLTHLEDEGHVLISLPNIAAWPVRLRLLQGKFDYQASGILDRDHVRFFTRQSAIELIEAAGLELLVSDLNPMLSRALLRERGLGLAEGSGAAESGRAFNLDQSLPFALYAQLGWPVERLLARLSPELMAFQHVFLARKQPKPRPLSLTIGMLTMDEELAVRPMIELLRAHAPDAQLLCVDSSTRDRTPELARELGARVIRQVPARGHGPAMEALLYAVETEALITIDCDGTYPAESIPLVRRLLEQGADLVNGARTAHKPEAMPFANYLANRTFAAAAEFAHGVPTVDVHSGMRGYRTSMLRAFNFDGEGDALPIDTLLKPVRHGYQVVELPIGYNERIGDSKLRKLSGTAWTFVRLASNFGSGGRGPQRFERRPHE